MDSLKRLLREPLLHFLLIGLALFAYYGRVATSDGEGRRIVVTQAQVDELARQHEATWMRPPTAQELAGLVDSYVQDEILYREGRSLGLDRDDPVIKRRVRQKLDVMSEEALDSEAPGEADLAAYLESHREAFQQPAIVSYEQVLVASGGTDEEVARRVADARSALQRGADPSSLGQPTLLPPREDDVALDLVARSFGEAFAKQIETIPIGQWVGPVASGFGVHLVRVSARTPTALPPLDAVRSQVAREWEADRRRRSLAEVYRRLRQNYLVVIEAKLPEVPP